MAAIVVISIPFGNVLPALGLMMAGLALLATAGLMLAAWVWGTEWILGWFSI